MSSSISVAPWRAASASSRRLASSGISAPVGFWKFGVTTMQRRSGNCCSANSTASGASPVRGAQGTSTGRSPSIAMVWCRPKYTGLSISTLSPGRVTARSARLMASVAPWVTSTASVGTSMSSVRRRSATTSRSGSQPCGGARVDSSCGSRFNCRVSTRASRSVGSSEGASSASCSGTCTGCSARRISRAMREPFSRSASSSTGAASGSGSAPRGCAAEAASAVRSRT